MACVARRVVVGAVVLAAAAASSGCCARVCGPTGAPSSVGGPVRGTAAPLSPAAATPTAAAEATLVLVEATVLRVPAARAAEVLGPTYGGTGLGMGLLPAADAAALLARAEAASARVLQAPAVLTRSGDEASVFVGEDHDPTPHRVARAGGFDAALADPSWSGLDLRMSPTALDDRRLAFDLSCIHRDPPPDGTPADRAAWLGTQLRGRMGVATMASGDAAMIVLARGSGEATGDRVVLVAVPRLLPPEAGTEAPPPPAASPAR